MKIKFYQEEITIKARLGKILEAIKCLKTKKKKKMLAKDDIIRIIINISLSGTVLFSFF